jgi:hypothetical protein
MIAEAFDVGINYGRRFSDRFPDQDLSRHYFPNEENLFR